ncbi:MAG: acyltransferase 3 [Frankiales bacterium]|nr:acyltransferase 3 [Frankiales bacterium]
MDRSGRATAAASAGTAEVADEGGLESAASPARPERFPCLDGVRALAALTVVLTHVGFQTGEAVSGPFRTVLARFDAGVAVFFVLSGFLLHRPQAVAALRGLPLPAVRPYLWRRALRVLPGYWLAVALAAAAVPAVRALSTGALLRQLTLTTIYTGTEQVRGLTQVWSLCTEVSFYLALPLLGRLVARRGLRGQLVLCGALYAVALAWQDVVAHGHLPPHLGYWLPGHLDWFALGMALAALSAAGARVLDQVADDAGTCWLGAAALFAVAGTPLTGPYGLALLSPSQTLSRSVLYGLVAVLLVLPAVAGDPGRGPVRALLRSRPAEFLGRVSYGVFLLHLVVLDVALRVLHVPVFTGRMPLVLAVVLPVSVLLAWGSLLLVEQPALRFKDRFRDRAPDPAPGPVPATG